MSTSVKPSARTTALAAIGGIVALVAVFGFAVGLPKVSDDPDSSEGAGSAGDGPQITELGALPDALPGGLVSFLSPDMPDALLEQAGGVDQATAAIASASDNLGELYGEPTAFGIYGKADGSGLVTVTIGPGEPGLFVPDGAPVSAEVQGAARAALEVVRVDAETVCSVLYDQPLAEGQPAEPAELPARIHCQLGSSGLLYDVTGQGISLDDLVAATDAIRDQVETPAT